MSENETQQSTPETIQPTHQPTPQTAQPSASAVEQAPKGSMVKIYTASVIVVLLIVVGVLFQLEKEGRSSTNLFGSIIENQAANEVVATVNGEIIRSNDLSTSIEQFSQVAAAQGVDITSAEAQADIREQSLVVLINTTLLKQEAADRGLIVSDEQVAERLTTIETELGGAEVLEARMAELGIDAERLAVDVKDEILIQQLLDEVFVENEITASEEEIMALYESAGGEAGGLPPFEEIADQVAQEVVSVKEQEIIDSFLDDLKVDAEIDIVGE
jgi:hypothetical protein